MRANGHQPPISFTDGVILAGASFLLLLGLSLLSFKLAAILGGVALAAIVIRLLVSY